MSVFPRWRVVFALVLLCTLAYAPAFLAVARGELPFGGDVLAAFGPWHEFARTSLHGGTLPLWNPHVFCGMPFMANGQSAVFYPPNAIYFLLSLPAALLCDAWLHNIVLALGTYVLARALGQSRSSALLAAGILALCGAVSARIYAGHMTWHAARAWIPWMLWALLLLLRTGQARFALLLALCGALLVSAGHPLLALLGLFLCTGLLFAYSISRWRDGVAALTGRSMALLGLSALLSVAIGAGTLLPLFESTRLSTHGGFDFEFATRGSGTWKSLVRLFLPDFFGGNSAPQWSLKLYGHEEAASLGLLAAILALAAPFLARDANNRTSRAISWLWLLLPVAFVLSMGKHTPIYGLAFEHLPGFSSLRLPVRWLELWLLPGALLAGFSCDGLFAHPKNKVAPQVFGSLLFGVAAVLALYIAVFPFIPPFWPPTTSPTDIALLRKAAFTAMMIALFVVFGGAILVSQSQKPTKTSYFQRVFVCLALGEMLLLFWRSALPAKPVESAKWPPALVAQYREGQRWETALGGDYPRMNGGLTAGIDLYNGYDPAAPRRFFDFASAVENYPFYSLSYEPIYRSALLRVAGVTHGLKSDFTLQPYAGVWPRVYLTNRVWRLPEKEQLARLKELASEDFTGQAWPVVVENGSFPAVRPAPESPKGSSAGQITHWHRTLNQFKANVTTNAPTVLVVTEAYYPGWRAFSTTTMRSQELTIAPANYLFRGAALPPGTQRVTMVYEPQSARLGFFLMLCGLGALAAGATILYKR